MKIYNSLIIQKKPLSIALGYFDGIHKGHQKVISWAVKLKNLGLTPAVLTFNQSPKSVLFGYPENKIISTEEKNKILESMNIELLYSVDFEQIRDLSPNEFVREILSKKLNVKYAVCGFNYHFGKDGIADATALKEICRDYGIKTKIVKPVLYKNKPISSTRIRTAISQKDDKDACNMISR